MLGFNGWFSVYDLPDLHCWHYEPDTGSRRPWALQNRRRERDGGCWTGQPDSQVLFGVSGQTQQPLFFICFVDAQHPTFFSTFNCNHCKRVQGSNIRCNKKIEPTWPDFIPFQMLFLAVPCLQHPLLTVASYHRPPLHTLLLSHVQPFLKATLQFKDIWPKWYMQFLPFCSCFDPF